MTNSRRGRRNKRGQGFNQHLHLEPPRELPAAAPQPIPAAPHPSIARPPITRSTTCVIPQPVPVILDNPASPDAPQSPDAPKLVEKTNKAEDAKEFIAFYAAFADKHISAGEATALVAEDEDDSDDDPDFRHAPVIVDDRSKIKPAETAQNAIIKDEGEEDDSKKASSTINEVKDFYALIRAADSKNPPSLYSQSVKKPDSLVHNARVFYSHTLDIDAVLTYVSMLVTEIVYATPMKAERPTGIMTAPMISAVGELLRDMEFELKKLYDEKTGRPALALNAIEIIATCCQEVTIKNEPRFAAFSRNSEEVTDFFLNSEAIHHCLGFIESIFLFVASRGFGEEASECFWCLQEMPVLVQWFWLYCLDRFANILIPNLMTHFGKQFGELVEVMRHSESETESENISRNNMQRSILSIVEALKVYARDEEKILQDSMRNMVQIGLKAGCDGDRCIDYSFVFIFKLASFSSDMLKCVTACCADLLTVPNVLSATQQILCTPPSALCSKYPLLTFFTEAIRCCDIRVCSTILPTLLTIGIDDNSLEQFCTKNPTLAVQIRAETWLLVTRCIDRLLLPVHAKMPLNTPRLMYFARGSRLQECINASLRNSTCCGPGLQRYFHMISVITGDPAEIVCRYIFSMDHPTKVSTLITFISTIIPFFPNLMNNAYANLLRKRANFERERIRQGDSTFTHSLNWVINLCALLEWEAKCPENDDARHFKLNPGEHSGKIISGILRWIIDESEIAVEEQNVSRLCSLAHYIECFLSLVGPTTTSDIPKPPEKSRTILLRPSESYVIALQLARHLQIVLTGIEVSGDSVTEGKDVLSVFASLNVAYLSFFVRQNSPSASYMTCFFISFIDCSLQNAKDLFGDCTDYKCDAPASLDDELREEFEDFNFISNDVAALAQKKGANQLAHSGKLTFGRGGRKGIQSPTASQHLRRRMLIEAVRLLLEKMPKKYQERSAKEFASLLVLRLCGDAMNGDSTLEAFEIEREMISRYVKITLRLSSPVAEGLCLVVASHSQCIFYLFPILKAAVLDTMALLDNASDRLERRPNDVVLEKLDRWLRLAIKGRLLPQNMLMLADIIPICSCYEAFLILSEVYEMLKPQNLVSRKPGDNFRPDIMLSPSLLDTLIAILQRDMANRGRFFSDVIAAFAVNEVDSPAEPDGF